MKYFVIKQIVEYLIQKTKNIKFIKRINNNIIIIEFNNKEILYFDMTKGKSQIYKKTNQDIIKNDFNAPFDILLQKRFTNSKIEDICIYNEDKVINIKVSSSSSYKKLITILQLEFTGKHTNIIILDENRIILEALRHIDEFSSSRVVKVGMVLDEIPKQNFIFKEEFIKDIEKYLYETYTIKEKNNLEDLKKQKISLINKKINKLEKLIDELPLKEELERDSNHSYLYANIILNNIYNIKPYQEFLETNDYEGNSISIPLDKSISASKYANILFKKAKRLKQKLQNINIEKQSLEEKLEFSKKMIENLQEANSIDEIEFLFPKKQKNQTKTIKQQNYETFFYNGYKILLGRNERENIYLLQNSKANDFWFHLKDRTSCHIIVQNSKKTIPEAVILKAAKLCAKFSVEFGGNYLVDYTQRRNIKIQSGSNVLYNPYTTIEINI